MVAHFIAALFASCTWKRKLDPIAVPFLRMNFALGQVTLVILLGLDGVILKAMPPAAVFLRGQLSQAARQ